MKRREIRPLADPALVERLSARLCERGSLAGIAPAVVAELVRCSALLELDAGELLVREGELAAPEVYLLVEGLLGVTSKGNRIATLERPGDVIGEVAVVLSARRVADVTAESAVQAIAVPVDVLGQAEFADVAAGIRGAMLRDDWIQY